ncbi:MAG: methyltransferase domain-containing protein [Candidatus Omnitrophica bacterium]|nr:methyltransferase domain-containing protein [Candidatus Omnitrophota bacterium]
MSSELMIALDVINGSCRYNQWIYSLLKPHLSGIVLDIGSGLGNIASLFVKPEIEEVIFSECDAALFAELRKQPFSLKKFRMLSLDITKLDDIESLNSERINTTTCVNVLEHIEDDIGALINMKQILVPGGTAVILVPALMGIYGSLDSIHGHFRRYTHKTLSDKMKSAGFTVKTWRYMNILGVFSWFFAARVLKQKKFSQKTCGFLDKMVPLFRRMEKDLQLPFGQSLLMVGEKL